MTGMDPAMGHNSESRLVAFGLNDGAGGAPPAVIVHHAFSIGVGTQIVQALQASALTATSIDVGARIVSGKGSS
jgi:hypothetical protein